MMHIGVLIFGACEPAAQASGEADPSGQKLPCGQSVHSLCALAPAALRYVPASHAIAALAPSLQWWPRLHSKQDDWPSSG